MPESHAAFTSMHALNSSGDTAMPVSMKCHVAEGFATHVEFHADACESNIGFAPKSY